VYWMPSWRGWDSLWYHEPIVGFAIQTHSLHVYPLPSGIQNINGYPKAAELTALWWVIFTDRRLIDLSSCIAAPCLMLATYTLMRRFSEDRVHAIGWASAVMLMPAATSELQTLYIDIHYAWLLVVTLLFATRPVFRLRDAIFCSFAATLLLGTKGLALVPGPLLLIIALWRLYEHNGDRKWAATGVALFGFALAMSMLGSVYIRNWVVFHNPFWPTYKLDIDKWNIHWPGDHEASERGRSGADINEDWSQFFTDAFSAPYSWHYGEVHDYGFAVPWLIWPLASIAIIVIVALVVRGWFGHLFRIPSWRPSRETATAALIALTLVALVVFSPARWAARYHIGTTAMFMAVCAWVSGSHGYRRLSEGIVACAIIGEIAANYWESQRWWTWPSELATLIEIPYPEREMTPATAFTTAFFTNGACVTADVGVARERELGKGDVLAYDDAYGNFVAILWNDKFSNRIEWVPEGPDFLENAKAIHAKWIYLTHTDESVAKIRASGEWEEVGVMNVENWGSAWRRIGKP